MKRVTLLTDFGLQDGTAASVKGLLLQHLPDATLIDISHQVMPFHAYQAAYVLQSTYRNFPEGTCHLVLCDVFYSKNPRLILCKHDKHYFLAPDNGILSLAFRETDVRGYECFQLQKPQGFHDWVHACGKMIASITEGGLQVLGLPISEFTHKLHHWQTIRTETSLECHVIHIDRFENVIVNLMKPEFEQACDGRTFTIEFMRNNRITQLSDYYHDVSEGELLVRFNDAGFLEIAINRGKAASLLGMKMHREHQLIYNTIKISFA